jgi:glucan-binding YG repeat protein
MSMLSVQSANISDVSVSSYSYSDPETSLAKTAVKQATSDDSVTISSEAHAALAAAQSADDDPFAGMSVDQLQAIHSQVESELTVGSDAASLAANAAQLPNPATPDRIASAESATEYVQSGENTPNPFSGYSRSDLTKVIYDQSGTYTINERIAAQAQQEDNDSAYLLAASSKTAETGDIRYLHSALLQLDQQKTSIEKAASNETSSFALSSTELTGLLNQANTEKGEALPSTLSYPGGWTS